jgi:small subunit ribosomal protein S21
MNRKQKQHQQIVPGHALAVHVPTPSREDFSHAMKTWKRKVKDSKILDNLKSRKEYIKPSVTKRQERIRAAYIQRMRSLNM